MRYKGGFNTYGQAIGVLVLETDFPRVPGDMGNATTFPFPVRYKVIGGANAQTIMINQDRRFLGPYIEAAKELEAAGCKAITTSCGFLAMFQKEMAAALNIPVFTSALLQLPVVYRMLRPDQKVGVVTASAKSLNPGIIESVGATDVSIAVVGLEDKWEFTTNWKTNDNLQYDAVKEEVLDAVGRLVHENPDIGALVFECTNLQQYSKDIQDLTGLPIFDVVTMTKCVHSALVQKAYQGYM